jgi:VWFA-related protein
MVHRLPAALLVAFLAAVAAIDAQSAASAPGGTPGPDQPPAGQPATGITFRSAVDLVNVTATVTDRDGRFAQGLGVDDFLVYDNGVRQNVIAFASERVPVSLGIVLDTSGSMKGEKIRSARAALEQFLGDLDDPDDEFFLYQFNAVPLLLQGWTRNRRDMTEALSRTSPEGDTALFDAVARSVPMLAVGRNTKKALVILSDGNDSSSRARPDDVARIIRDADVLVYAVGINGTGSSSSTPSFAPPPPPRGPEPRIPRIPFPFPRPAPRLPGGVLRSAQWPGTGSQRPGTSSRGRGIDGVNGDVLRRITNDSGGRTEIIRDVGDLRSATSSIAGELRQQYSLGYVMPPTAGATGAAQEGRWHTIRVEVTGGAYRVRARSGYLAR